MLNKTRKGFTLIELLIVVVIIGILAAIAIPKFANTKEKAYLASMKSDLRNMATTQESYFADYQIYIAGTAANTASGGTGWSATSGHSATTKTCAIFVGVGAVSPATVEAEPKCQ